VVECCHTSEEYTASIFKATETVPVDSEMLRKKMCNLFRRVQGIQSIVAIASRKRRTDCPEPVFPAGTTLSPDLTTVAESGQIPSNCHT
jgi:hypothetical protein